LESEDNLDFATALKLASIIPKEQRHSFDTLALTLAKAYHKDPHKSEVKQHELLAHIDLYKVSENTLEQLLKENSVPHKLVAEAAIALVHRLRKQLNEATNCKNFR
jgi:hypothetical protein